MGAEPGRRFLKQPAEKLKAVFVANRTSDTTPNSVSTSTWLGVAYHLT